MLCMMPPTDHEWNSILWFHYTPHRTRLLKMPLFPMITFWQRTDMSWTHPIFWFPWVLQFYIEWYMSTSLLVFLFPYFAGKHGFCTEINHAVHKKAQLLTHLYNKTKTRGVKKGVQAFPLSMLLRKWIWWHRILYHGYVHIRGLKRNHCWSSRLAVLHCECCFALFGSALCSR